VERIKFLTLPGLDLRTLGGPGRSRSLYRLLDTIRRTRTNHEANVYRGSCLAGRDQHSHMYEPRAVSMLNRWQVLLSRLLFLSSDCQPSAATDKALSIQYALKFNFMAKNKKTAPKTISEEGRRRGRRNARKQSTSFLQPSVSPQRVRAVSRRVTAVWKQFHLNKSFATNAGGKRALRNRTSVRWKINISKRNKDSKQGRWRTLRTLRVRIYYYNLRYCFTVTVMKKCEENMACRFQQRNKTRI
jgi:hypothetical protein